jgi:hypothetical protein
MYHETADYLHASELRAKYGRIQNKKRIIFSLEEPLLTFLKSNRAIEEYSHELHCIAVEVLVMALNGPTTACTIWSNCHFSKGSYTHEQPKVFEKRDTHSNTSSKERKKTTLVLQHKCQVA